jgi:hypothetical protein
MNLTPAAVNDCRNRGRYALAISAGPPAPRRDPPSIESPL